MENFLTHIQAPTLGSSTFATDLQEAFRTIDDNFKKIVAAPYLEGQEGRSIVSVDLALVDDGELTEMGKTAAREIFSSPDINTLEDIDTVAPKVCSVQSHSASDYLVAHPTIKVLAKWNPDTGQIDSYLCSAEYYCFLDMRVEDLGSLQNPSTQTTFVDYTCQLFGDYGSTGWTFSKGVMLPTLYYNSEQGAFCWKINSVETGIRAQGLKGDAGKAPLAAVTRGSGYTGIVDGVQLTTVNVSEFLPLTTQMVEGEIIYAAEWAPVTTSELQNGDLVACLFSIADSTYGTVYPDMVIGNLTVTSDGLYRILLPDANRFSNLWRSYLTFYAFRDIDYKTTSGSVSKAVFVPSDKNGIVHAMFQDDSGVNYTQQGGEWTSTDGLNESNLVFKKVRENRLVGEQAMGDTNKMTSPDTSTDFRSSVKFLGYNSEVEGTSKSEVNGLPSVLLGSPVGSIVNWINMEHLPEGWYQTGEVTEYVPPVFGLRVADITSNDYDVVILNSGNAMKKFTICSIDSNGDLVDRDFRFAKIFTALSGYAYSKPIEITTDYTTYEEFKSGGGFHWTQFDWEDVSGGLAFYLTKRI